MISTILELVSQDAYKTAVKLGNYLETKILVVKQHIKVTKTTSTAVNISFQTLNKGVKRI